MQKKRFFILCCCLLAFVLPGLLGEWAENFHPAAWHEGYEQAMSSEVSQNGRGQPPNFHLHINLDQLEMYVYRQEELVKTYPVSGGKRDTPSPVGTWKIIHKDTWGEGFGGAWMGFNVPWGTYGIHGTIEPWFVGRKNASEGCIRMKNADVRELFKLVPYGTTVTIVYDEIPFRIMHHGDVGSDVVEIEKALKQLKYYSGGLDGVFGDSLDVGIKKFQQDNRLRVTGKINSSTYNLIMELYHAPQYTEQ